MDCQVELCSINFVTLFIVMIRLLMQVGLNCVLKHLKRDHIADKISVVVFIVYKNLALSQPPVV